MSRAEPWFKFFPSDWRGGTACLSAAEKGVYVTLIACIYDAGGPLRRDDARLARECGLPKVGFVRALDALIALGKITDDEGWLFNSRAKNELTERENRIRHCVSGANVTNEKKSIKSMQENRSSDQSAHAPACAPRARLSEPEPEREERKKDSAKSAESSRALDEQKKISPEEKPSPPPELEFRMAICDAFLEAGADIPPETGHAAVWLAQGYSAELCLSVIRSKMPGARDKSLKWFSPAIADLHAGRAVGPPATVGNRSTDLLASARRGAAMAEKSRLEKMENEQKKHGEKHHG